MSDSAPARKRRIPKACGSCRVSKVRCDGLRPCSRCRTLRKVCEFVERPKDPHESKMEALEKEIEALKAQLKTPANSGPSVPSPSSWPGMPLVDAGVNLSGQRPGMVSVGAEQTALVQARLGPLMPYSGSPRVFPTLHSSPSSDVSPGAAVAGVSVPIPEATRLVQAADTSATASTASQKRSRAHFEAGTPPAIPDLDPVSAGLITLENAVSYFNTFFSGCDRYVPVFDPLYDTFDSVRHRSTLLFSAICSVGCRVQTGAESHQSRLLGVHIQRMLNVAIAAVPGRGSGPQTCGLETVQALLVRACYAAERSLLVAVATRMALEMGLPEAYGVLSARCVTNPRVTSLADAAKGSSSENADDDDGATLMRKTRTWLHLLMMGQILHVDAGGPPGFRFRGAAQRCRILLDNPHATGIDLYLFSQVELNALRTRIHSTISRYRRTHPSAEREDDEIMDLVSDACIDLNVWFDDWARIYERHTPQMPWLAPNLAVQRCWADAMAMCAALRAAGIENVRAMSAAQTAILRMAKRSLRQHLDIILQEPRVYLRSIRYAMDFVWAKNAFCYLLLLKLSVLLPDEDESDGSVAEELVDKGRMLLEELSKAGGGLNNRDGVARNSTSSLYLHLVRVSIEKFRHAMRSGRSQGGRAVGAQAQSGVTQERRGSGEGRWPPDQQQTELESFVPEQFVFEWDFPGLTFFSSPTNETGWLDELLAGAFDGSDSFYNLGWASMDLNLS
ncbi:hypothetical protein VTI74DRAFT_234 [Chaetomium olivicolor]